MGYRYPFLDLYKVNNMYIGRIKEAAERVICSGRYVGGHEVEAMERALAVACGVPDAYVVGVSSGLDALRLALRSYMHLGRLAPGDEVIVPANTYIATVLAVTDCGLVPVMVDPDVLTMNIDTSLIEGSVTPRTRAVMPVHLYGRVVWDGMLMDTVRRHNLLVIEDNAQAIGATAPVAGFNGSRISGTLGHAGAFSFYPTKNVGAMGEAGAVLTFDAQLAETLRAMRNYGQSRQYHNELQGYNCRLDPLQAAIVALKLPELEFENSSRRAIAGVYDRMIDNPYVSKPIYDGTGISVWHQYVVRVKDRDRFRDYMAGNGVETAVHYPVPPHKQACYPDMNILEFPVAENIARECVSLPVSRCTTLSDAEDISMIINKYCHG